MKVRHVIITGPESSGKTTLAAALAQKFNGIFIPEYPRAYLEAIGRKVQEDEFSHFLRVNQQLLEAAKDKLNRREGLRPVIFQDTGIEVLHLWMEDKFGGASVEVKAALFLQQPDTYLLCKPDLTWEYDPLREDPHRRKELFQQMRNLVGPRQAKVFEVVGQGKKRAESATRFLKSLF